MDLKYNLLYINYWCQSWTWLRNYKTRIGKNNFVLATYRTLSNDLYNLSKTCTNIKLIKMDVSNNTSVKNAVNKIKKLIKTLDIIYSNAGILNKNHKVNFKNVLFDRSITKL